MPRERHHPHNVEDVDGAAEFALQDVFPELNLLPLSAIQVLHEVVRPVEPYARETQDQRACNEVMLDAFVREVVRTKSVLASCLTLNRLFPIRAVA